MSDKITAKCVGSEATEDDPVDELNSLLVAAVNKDGGAASFAMPSWSSCTMHRYLHCDDE